MMALVLVTVRTRYYHIASDFLQGHRFFLFFKKKKDAVTKFENNIAWSNSGSPFMSNAYAR